MTYKYIGGADQWLPGIPARDLTDEEAERWPEVKSSAFYVVEVPAARSSSPTAPAGNVAGKAGNNE